MLLKTCRNLVWVCWQLDRAWTWQCSSEISTIALRKRWNGSECETLATLLHPVPPFIGEKRRAATTQRKGQTVLSQGMKGSSHLRSPMRDRDRGLCLFRTNKNVGDAPMKIQLDDHVMHSQSKFQVDSYIGREIELLAILTFFEADHSEILYTCWGRT